MLAADDFLCPIAVAHHQQQPHQQQAKQKQPAVVVSNERRIDCDFEMRVCVRVRV